MPVKRGHYVYVIAVDGVFRYIGMGSGKRKDYPQRKGRAGQKINKALDDGCDVEIIVLKNKLTKAKAAELERFALQNTKSGLWNAKSSDGNYISDGLEAGRTSAVHKKLWRDPDYREARRKSHSKSMGSKKVKAKLSTAAKARFKDPEKRAVWYKARWEGRKNTKPRPWELAGLSRSGWYRQRNAGLL